MKNLNLDQHADEVRTFTTMLNIGPLRIRPHSAGYTGLSAGGLNQNIWVTKILFSVAQMFFQWPKRQCEEWTWGSAGVLLEGP